MADSYSNNKASVNIARKVLPGWLEKIIKKFADEHLPVLDYDGDRFSDFP